MPSNPRALADLNNVRSALAATRQLSERLLSEVAARESKLEQVLRTRNPADPAVIAADTAFKQAVQNLRKARADEHSTKEDVQKKLGTWLAGFAPMEEAKELSAKFPLVLLPVRVETRFWPVSKPQELRVRIYPDEIMAETHEPVLTEKERAIGCTYWKKAWKVSDEPEAWRALVRRYPPTRAAWIVRETTPVNISDRATAEAPKFPAATDSRPASWTRAAEARVLPDRWMVLAYRKGVEVYRVLNGPVLDPVALSVDPAETDPAHLVDISGDGLAVDPAVLWTVDFEQAKKAGMAVTIKNLNRVDVEEGFDRLVVVGVKASLKPEETSQRLARLFEGHHYSEGLAFVPQGTPTNNTADGPSGFPPQDPGGSASYTVERQGLSLTAESDGMLFLTALGLSKRLAGEIRHLTGADRTEQLAARAMNQALWPATWGYYLEQMLAPGFDRAAIAEVRDYFAKYVRGRGPLPAFRVGATPYGVLPVSSLMRWRPAATSRAPSRWLPAVLTALRETWIGQVDNISRIGRTKDADGDLLDVLSMDASAEEVRVRSGWGEDLIANLLQFYGTDFFGVTGTWPQWSASRDRITRQVRQLLDRMGWSATTRNPRVAQTAFADAAYRFRYPLVTHEPLSEEAPLPAPNYISWIQKAPIVGAGSLKDAGLENPPLLYVMLRHAMLLEYLRAALDILIQHQLASEDDRREPELVNILVNTRFGPAPRPPVWHWFMQPHPDPVTRGLPLEQYLVQGKQPDTRQSDAYRDNLNGLKGLPTAELERLFTETLDTCSHRLDAWVTSLATQRLESMRRVQPDYCHLGAFGWVENLRPATKAVEERQLKDGRTVYVQITSGGYVHAPSLTHAATAAVLRNGFLTRAAEPNKPFAINLSSARVRAARWLLDAVRQGQPLGAVLGYRFERRLHELQLEKYIAPLRARYPLVAGKGQPAALSGQAVEAIAARNVVDGLTMLRTKDPFATLNAPPVNAPPKDVSTLGTELSVIGAALDAAADLLTAESVHQMIRGNPGSAVASLDAMSQGVRPPDPQIARVPRGGITLTHRVAIVLGGSPLAPMPGWPATPTPRAEAEPYLDGWAGVLLGDPRAVKCRVSYPDPSDPTRRAEIEVTLDELALRPVDVLALAGEGVPSGQGSELDRRVAEVVLAKLKVAVADLRISYAPDPTWDPERVRSFQVIFEVARALLAVLGGARALRPEDLVPPEMVAEARDADWLPDEASKRAWVARGALEVARTALNDKITKIEGTPAGVTMNLGPLLDALRRASLFGVPGAFPVSGNAEELLTQARSVRTELDQRIAAASASPATAAVAIIEAVFGNGFVFLPRFKPASPTAGELDRALGAGPTLVGNPQATRKWLQQAAQVRSSLRRWWKLKTYLGAIETGTGNLEVVQLPHAQGAKWVALPFSPSAGPPPSGRLSLVLHRAAKPTATDPWVGLVLDEWSEVIPHAAAQTGVVFHYDDPGAEAAQAVLIAIPPADGSVWDPVALVDILNETLDLAKMRLVDGDLLGELGQILPSIYIAENTAADAIEAKLSAMRIGEQRVGP